MSAAPPVVDCFILDTGYCLASESHLIRGGQRRSIRCHSLAALLRHPSRGWLLWDTGYAPRMLSETSRWPYWLYRLATPLHIRPEQAAVAQITRQGIWADEVKTVILSHFHADHLAGLLDFPQAAILADRAGFADAAPRRGLRALQRAFIPSLLPADFEARATLLDGFQGPEVPGLGACHDVFEDGSLQIVRLPGHARGQLGLLANTRQGLLLFAADSAWLSQSIRERKPPARLTNLIADHPEAVQHTLDRLHSFWKSNPNIRILPTHCPEALAWGQEQAPPASAG
jgi:glyoxylase-like metal-dependent hydrolase (beta-lactamase superfamily II)